MTPADLEVAPGTHTVSVSLEGYRESSQEVTVEFAEEQNLPLPLSPGSDEVAPDDLDDTPVVEGGRSSTGLYVAAGVTGVALVAGTVFGFLALGDQSDFDDDPTEDTADRGERFALFADIAFGVAAAAGITTLVLFLTRGPAEVVEEEETDEALRLRLAPLALRNGGGMAAHLRF